MRSEPAKGAIFDILIPTADAEPTGRSRVHCLPHANGELRRSRAVDFLSSQPAGLPDGERFLDSPQPHPRNPLLRTTFGAGMIIGAPERVAMESTGSSVLITASPQNSAAPDIIRDAKSPCSRAEATLGRSNHRPPSISTPPICARLRSGLNSDAFRLLTEHPPPRRTHHRNRDACLSGLEDTRQSRTSTMNYR